eukprot:4625267-Amphidinium_carterae.1
MILLRAFSGEHASADGMNSISPCTTCLSSYLEAARHRALTVLICPPRAAQSMRCEASMATVVHGRTFTQAVARYSHHACCSQDPHTVHAAS